MIKLACMWSVFLCMRGLNLNVCILFLIDNLCNFLKSGIKWHLSSMAMQTYDMTCTVTVYIMTCTSMHSFIWVTCMQHKFHNAWAMDGEPPVLTCIPFTILSKQKKRILTTSGTTYETFWLSVIVIECSHLESCIAWNFAEFLVL